MGPMTDSRDDYKSVNERPVDDISLGERFIKLYLDSTINITTSGTRSGLSVQFCIKNPDAPLPPLVPLAMLPRWLTGYTFSLA